MSAGPCLKLDGDVIKWLGTWGLKSFDVSWKLADIKVKFAGSLDPQVKATRSTSATGPVTLSADASGVLSRPADGTTVEFVGYKDKSTKGVVLASAAVKGGKATATWQPDKNDTGSYKVFALVYSDPAFAALQLPFASSKAATLQPPGTEIFKKLTKKFWFTMGVGAWATELQIKSDGSFAGHYWDDDMGVTGPGYPNGTRHESYFSGKFTSVKQISQYEYTMKVGNLKVKGTVGQEKIVDGVNVITDTPYGLDDARDIILYLPGRSTADLPQAYLEWIVPPNAWDSVPARLPFYGLYNAGGEQGWFSDL